MFYVGIEGFPAHAGIDLPSGHCQPRALRVPRTRGDIPPQRPLPAPRSTGSPHTRGYTGDGDGDGDIVGGFPAHAGIYPDGLGNHWYARWVPRTRGDIPYAYMGAVAVYAGSPHTRGYTAAGKGLRDILLGFPAHAGIYPRRTLASDGGHRVPRTRGDIPGELIELDAVTSGSPHTRGYTFAYFPAPSLPTGFPAHAGIDPGYAHG